jgi:hypothetical protein
LLIFPLDDRGGRLAGQSGSMEQVVILQNADGTGPLESGKSRLHRATQRIIEGEQPGSLTRPKDEVRQPFRTIVEGADNEGLR